MYRIGEVVTLNIHKTEGAGENSLSVSAGITGMVVNAGRGCREGDFSYVVDFGPEGQWNCVHSEIDSLNTSGWDDDTEENNEEYYIPRPEVQHDITEEQVANDRGGSLPLPEAEPLLAFQQEMYAPPVKKHKTISFEDDLARMAAEAEANQSPF